MLMSVISEHSIANYSGYSFALISSTRSNIHSIRNIGSHVTITLVTSHFFLFFLCNVLTLDP